MPLAKMMEKDERKKSAIRHKAYSIAEHYALCELLILRLIRNNPGSTASDIGHRMVPEAFKQAKVDTGYIYGYSHLLMLVGHLLKANHLKGPDVVIEPDYYGTNIKVDFDEQVPLEVTPKGRHYMLSMPGTVQTAATRIMQPYTVLDRIAAAIPKIEKKPRPRRRRRRRK